MQTISEKKRIVRWLRKWRKNLLLQHWTINVTLNNNPRSDDEGCRADVDTNEAYWEIEINIYPIFWEDPITAQERTILHELSHVLVSPLKLKAYEGRKRSNRRDKAIQQEVELLTEYITNLMWDAYKS